jgi:hypothetical protein
MDMSMVISFVVVMPPTLMARLVRAIQVINKWVARMKRAMTKSGCLSEPRGISCAVAVSSHPTVRAQFGRW